VKRFLRDNVKIVVIAMVTAMVTAGAPAVAHGVQHALFAHNADKVDGKHAVGSGASVNSRKGKLVATSPTTGRLPNNIIAKAADANKLDGADSTAFLKNQGQTIVPVWGPWYPSGAITVATNSLDTTITRASAGSGVVVAMPTVPVRMFSKPMSLVGAKICYDAGVATVDIDQVKVSVVTETSAYSLNTVDAVNAPDNLTGTTCTTFSGTPTPMTADSYPQITISGIWTGAGNLYLTHSSLILAQS
jgi:hypothetical protein